MWVLELQAKSRRWEEKRKGVNKEWESEYEQCAIETWKEDREVVEWNGREDIANSVIRQIYRVGKVVIWKANRWDVMFLSKETEGLTIEKRIEYGKNGAETRSYIR